MCRNVKSSKSFAHLNSGSRSRALFNALSARNRPSLLLLHLYRLPFSTQLALLSCVGVGVSIDVGVVFAKCSAPLLFSARAHYTPFYTSLLVCINFVPGTSFALSPSLFHSLLTRFACAGAAARDVCRCFLLLFLLLFYILCICFVRASCVL